MKKPISKEQKNISTLVATQYSIDGGIVWEFHDIHIEVKGQAVVFSATDITPLKGTAMLRIAIVAVPPQGIQVGTFHISANEDLEEIKNNPDLLWILLDSLEWGEPFNPDELNWSDWSYMQAP